jgi:site-specific DNA-cytosine methylase
LRTYTVGSLFAGIGGFDLGFERAGFRTVWQVEIDPWCRKVLAKNFPVAERYADVRECGRHNLKPVDVIVGGFPCQDISNAGLRAGIEGERSGLWADYSRIIGELKDLVSCSLRTSQLCLDGELSEFCATLPRSGMTRSGKLWGLTHSGLPSIESESGYWHTPTTRDWKGQSGRGNRIRRGRGGASPYCEPLRSTCGFYPPGPRSVDDIPRMADGPANRMNRLRGLGNAVVPQIPELYARRIKQLIEELERAD